MRDRQQHIITNLQRKINDQVEPTKIHHAQIQNIFFFMLIKQSVYWKTAVYNGPVLEVTQPHLIGKIIRQQQICPIPQVTKHTQLTAIWFCRLSHKVTISWTYCQLCAKFFTTLDYRLLTCQTANTESTACRTYLNLHRTLLEIKSVIIIGFCNLGCKYWLPHLLLLLALLKMVSFIVG